MDIKRAINIAKGCVMASFLDLDSEMKHMVIEALNQVAISKTETDGCEWCEGELSFEVVWHDFINGERGSVNYCPNCGRRLEVEP